MIIRQVIKEEMTYECNYTHEAAYMRSSDVRKGSAAMHDLKFPGHEKGVRVGCRGDGTRTYVCGSSVEDDAILRLLQVGCDEVRPFPPPQPRGWHKLLGANIVLITSREDRGEGD